MSKIDDDTFNAQLRAQMGRGGKPQGEVLRQPPTGPRKSLAEMVTDSDSPILEAPSSPLNNQDGFDTGIASSPLNDENTVQELDVDVIDDSPYQPRNKYDENGIQILAAMLADRGQDEPIAVRRKGNRFELISGHRRIRAARMMHWKTIKGRVFVLSDEEAEKATLVANEGQEGLSDYERAQAYRRAQQKGFAKTQAEVGRMFGRSQARVSQCLSLLDLPAPVLSLLDEYPNLVGYRFVPMIDILVKEQPAAGEFIRQALLGLIDNPELTPDDIRAIVLKQCKVKPAAVKKPKPVVVVDSEGRNVFQVKSNAEKHEIVIKLDPDGSGDFDHAAKRIIANLREIASKGKGH